MPSPASATTADAKSASVPLASQIETAFGSVRAALAAYQEKPELPETLSEARAALQSAAELVAQWPRRQIHDAIVNTTRELLREVVVSGVHDVPAIAAHVHVAQKFSAAGWPGLLASMLLVPAWQWTEAPALDTVPDWLWGDYTAWLFAAPQGFCAVGQAETFANHTLKRLEELARWADRNAGSAAVRAAIETFARGSSAIPLYFSHQSLRRHAELRGKILQRVFVRPGEAHDPFPTPRAGRKLRVGFVNRHFGPQTETYTTLPTFEQLDRSRFDVILFAHHTGDSTLEAYCRSRAQEFYQLSGDLSSQLFTLRSAGLDVVVFGTNLTAVCNEVTLLALHRVAPLQVVNNSSCITSGLPEVDLYVSGTRTEIADAEAHFSERLGLLPGPAHAFNYEADRQEPTTTWSRENLGIPADATVFVSAANYFKIIPEMQHAWARLLASVPGSYLLLHPFNPNWSSSYPIQRFCAEFDRVLRSYGVDSQKLVVSTARFPSRNDVKELLRIGTVYLDTFPFGGVNSLVDPLELGLPVVVWEGETFRSRMGGALLRALGLPQLIATDEAAYRTIATELASDGKRREQLGATIQAAMERQPIFLDSLAASDAFGDLIEVAFDRVAEAGRAAFRAERSPLLAANVDVSIPPLPGSVEAGRLALRSAPCDPHARHELGKALHEIGEYARAAEYMLAAIQNDEHNAALWYDLAVSLRAAGQVQSAIQALEGSLKLDQTQLEAWLLLAELAHAAGAADLAQQAASVAKAIAPNDPRISVYLAD